MGRVIITDTLLDDLADAISTVTGESTPMSIEDMTDAVEAVTPRTSTDITVSGDTVSVPSGYYASSTSKTVASGTAGTPTATKGAVSNHSVDITPSVTNTTGYITGSTKTGAAVTVTAAELVSGSQTITSNGSGIDVTNLASIDVSVSGGSPNLQTKSKTYSPTESQQTDTITADVGYDGLDEVDITVNPISPTYVGSGITRRDDTDLSASGATVTVPSGYYEDTETKSVASGSVTAPSSITGTSATVSTGTNTMTFTKTVSVTPSVTTPGYVSSGTAGNASVSLTASVNTRSSSDLSASGATVTVPAGYYASQASKAVSNGTAGTPTATKGTVSNHSISVTPSVTNTSGYITGSTKTGTAVTVSASELVSGSQTITSNQTVDVTNLAEVVVNVSGGGGGKNVQYVMDSASVRTNGYSSTGISLTVAKTGTYKVSWVGWRSSSQGTMGTNLYKNGSAGTNQQTFTNTYGQCITLNNQSYTAGDVLTLYATAGSTSRYMWVANLIIEEQ